MLVCTEKKLKISHFKSNVETKCQPIMAFGKKNSQVVKRRIRFVTCAFLYFLSKFSYCFCQVPKIVKWFNIILIGGTLLVLLHKKYFGSIHLSFAGSQLIFWFKLNLFGVFSNLKFGSNFI